MKSAKYFLFPIFLIALSFLVYGCQSDETPETASTDEKPSEQKQLSSELQPISVDQISNIVWQWAELTEKNPAAQSLVPDPENYTLTFWNDGTFSFKADCNVGNGSYSVEGNKIEFGPMMSTMAMCPPESLHDQYLVLLGQVEGFGEKDEKLGLTLQEEAGEMRFNNGGPAEKPEPPTETPKPEEKSLYVGPEKGECVGVGPMECYQVKENPDDEWQLFYDQIEGFKWEPGYTYKLRVVVHPVENPPADASTLRYELIEVVNKVETPVESKNPEQYIKIEQPTDGTELDASNPIIVSGMGGALFEGTVVVRALDADGNELALQPTIIQSPEAGTGGEGPWQVELEITADVAYPGKIVAFATSPKDGSIVARDEVSVMFLPEMITTLGVENTAWQLVGLTDGALNTALAISQVTALFDPVEGRVSGVAGCNRYFASYELDGDQVLIPGPIGATRMMCPAPQMTIENTYLSALENVSSFEIMPNNTLNLFDADGNSILIFQVDPYSTTVSFTREEMANTSYLNEFVKAGIVQLVDGMYREPIAEDSATELVVMLTNFATFGDLDGDGQEEAVVVLVSNPGGSGTFYDLAVIRKQGEALTNLAVIQLGDRVQVQNLRIENGEISIEMLTQGPDDPMCCPTQHVINVYTLQSGMLVQTSSNVIEK